MNEWEGKGREEREKRGGAYHLNSSLAWNLVSSLAN